MKDDKGHGSNPRGAHSDGIDKIGRVPTQPGIWYHGSALDQPGTGYVHVGTHLAAREALEATVGIPADGKEWDGTREWGKTLLAGSKTQKQMEASGVRQKWTTGTGFNMRAPENDYYAKDRKDEHPAFSSPGHAQIPYESRPGVHAYEIHGNMSNNTSHPTSDTRANAMAGRLKNQGTYYKNEGEDSGSISAIVPNRDYLKRVG